MNEAHLSQEALAAYQAIQRAMVKSAPHTVRFDYTDAEGETSSREAEPYEIKDGKLFGWCLERDALRQFKLENMSGVTIGQPFRARYKVVVPC